MNVDCSLWALDPEFTKICFSKDKRNCYSALLGVKKEGGKVTVEVVYGSERTKWNFLLKFLGLGPLAGIDLHIEAVADALKSNWNVISPEITIEQCSTEKSLEKPYRIIDNIEQVFKKAQRKKNGSQKNFFPFKELLQELENKKKEIEQKKTDLKKTAEEEKEWNDFQKTLENSLEISIRSLDAPLLEQIFAKAKLQGEDYLPKLLQIAAPYKNLRYTDESINQRLQILLNNEKLLDALSNINQQLTACNFANRLEKIFSPAILAHLDVSLLDKLCNRLDLLEDSHLWNLLRNIPYSGYHKGKYDDPVVLETKAREINQLLTNVLTDNALLCALSSIEKETTISLEKIMDPLIVVRLDISLLQQFPAKLKLLSNNNLFELLKKVNGLRDSLSLQRLVNETNQLLQTLFSNDSFLNLLNGPDQAETVDTFINKIEYNSEKDLSNLPSLLTEYHQFTKHEIFKKLPSFSLSFARFKNLKWMGFEFDQFDKFLTLPSVFFAQSSWTNQFQTTPSSAIKNWWYKDDESLRKIRYYVECLELGIFEKISEKELSPYMIDQFSNILTVSFTNDDKKTLLENYYQLLPPEEAKRLQKKIGEVAGRCNKKTDVFLLLFHLISAPKDHFLKLRNMFDPIIKEVEKKQEESSVYNELISLIMEKPIKEQLQWAEIVIKSIGSEKPVELTKVRIDYFREVSLQTFKEYVETFKGRSCFNIVTYSFYPNLTIKNEPFWVKIVESLIELDGCFDLQASIEFLYRQYDQLSDFELPSFKLSDIGKKIKDIFGSQLTKEQYQSIFEQLLCQGDLQSIENHLYWAEVMFGKKASDLFEKSYRYSYQKNLILKEKLFSGFLASKTLEQRQQDILPVIKLFNFISSCASNERRHFFLEEESIRTLAEVLTELRFYRTVEEEGSAIFDADSLLVILRKCCCIEDLQKILQGNNQEYNDLIATWQQINQPTSDSRLPKSARSAFSQ